MSFSGNGSYYIAPHIILVINDSSCWDSRTKEQLQSSWSRLQCRAQASGLLLRVWTSGTVKYFSLHQIRWVRFLCLSFLRVQLNNMFCLTECTHLSLSSPAQQWHRAPTESASEEPAGQVLRQLFLKQYFLLWISGTTLKLAFFCHCVPLLQPQLRAHALLLWSYISPC